MPTTKFTRIKSAFSEARRLPRLGKIRLGLKKKSLRSGKEYPTETEYFVCPPEVVDVYGEKPTELDIMFPLDDPEQIFVQKLASYGATSGLKCHGNGEVAEEYDEKSHEWKPRKCPCEKLENKECGEQSHLMVLLPRVSMGGCYQITTGSYHSTVSINSSLDYIRGMAGRIAMLPMKLKRVPQEMTHEGKKRTHYTLNLVLDATLPQIIELRSNPSSLLIPAQYQIEGPAEINPKLDPVDVEEDEQEEESDGVDAAKLAEMDAQQLEDVRRQMDAKRSPPKEEAPKQPEQKPKPEQRPTPAESSGKPKAIPQDEWAPLVNRMASDQEMSYHLTMWMEANKVENPRRMTAEGQQSLLGYMRKAMGAAYPFKTV